MLVLGCSRASIPCTLPGVGSTGPTPSGCWQKQWLPLVVLVGQRLPLWVGCSSFSLFSWVWRSSVMVSSAVESCRCGSSVLHLFVFL